MHTSYHVHSTFSDGKTDIITLVKGAKLLGLEEMGVSDHYVVTPDGTRCEWSMSLDELPEYLAAIEEAQTLTEGRMKLLKGLEADYIPETIDLLCERLQPYDFDYIIGSVHFVEGFAIDESAENWASLSQDERNDIIRGYWTRVAGMARSGLYSFAGHLDLYKKFGYGPTIDISNEISEALDAIAASGMAVEINTAGLFWTCKEPYPSQYILEECHKREIPVLITADAHTPENLKRGYDEVEPYLAAAGYDIKVLWRPGI